MAVVATAVSTKLAQSRSLRCGCKSDIEEWSVALRTCTVWCGRNVKHLFKLVGGGGSGGGGRWRQRLA